MLGGGGDLDYHGRDNIAVDRLGRPLPMLGRYTTSAARIIEHAEPLDWPAGLAALSAVEVENWVLANAGARPWDRDPHDVRILADVAEGRGKIIDSETEVGGYPNVAPTRRAFDPNHWDLEDMTPRSPDVLDSSASATGTVATLVPKNKTNRRPTAQPGSRARQRPRSRSTTSRGSRMSRRKPCRA